MTSRDPIWSRDVIGHVTIRFPVGNFLFASSDRFSKRRSV